jgi:hypothetical protein
MSEQGGSAGGGTRAVRTLDDRVQSGVPATQYHGDVVESGLVEQPLIYDGNLPSRRFVDGQEVAPDGSEAELLVPGEDEHGTFVEKLGEKFYHADLALVGNGRSTVLLDSNEGPVERPPQVLQAAGDYEPSDADQMGAVIWLGKIAEIARDLKLSEATTHTFARRLLDFHSEVQAEVLEQDRLQAEATKAQLAPGDIEAINANLRKLPDGIGETIISARLPGGARLINELPIAQHYASLEVSGEVEQEWEAGDVASEYEELIQLMNTDIREFQQGKWRGRNISPSDRMLEIDRNRAA